MTSRAPPPKRVHLPVALAVTVLSAAAVHAACTSTGSTTADAGPCDAGLDDAGNPRLFYYDDAGRAYEYCPDTTPV